MDRPLSVDDLNSLDETEQGVVLAALLKGQDEGPLDRIAEGPRCRQALESFRLLDPTRP